MNSFTVTAVGNLAKDPETAFKGDTTYTKICLVGNDYAGKDEQGNAREAVTSLWFVAFESLGEVDRKKCAQGRSAHPPSADSRQQLDRQGRREAVRPFLRGPEFPLWRTGEGETRRTGRGATRETSALSRPRFDGIDSPQR